LALTCLQGSLPPIEARPPHLEQDHRISQRPDQELSRKLEDRVPHRRYAIVSESDLSDGVKKLDSRLRIDLSEPRRVLPYTTRKIS
jgi:hypothetical protein